MAEQEDKKKKIGEYVCKKLSSLKSQRFNWDQHWEEIAHYIIPRKDNIYTNSNPGGKKNNTIYDSTAIHANELLASALHGMLTNPASIWFGLTTGDDDLDKEDEVREWLDDSVNRMIRVLNNSNFQTEIHETYLDLGSLGTNVIRTEEDDELTVRFHSRPIYEHYIDENSKSEIDTVYREYEYTLRQIEQEFGEEVFDDQLKRDLEKNPLKKEKIIHAVEPSQDRNEKSSHKYSSYHVLKSRKILLKEKGFFEFPFAVPRWTKISSEKYGRSPGMKCLPDIKMINKMRQVSIRAAQKIVDPPLLAADDGVLLPVKTAPGSMNYKRAGMKDAIEPILTGGRVDIGEALIEQVKMQIRQSYFIDQLQLVENDRMTATEVVQRRDEQLRLLSPILGRLHFELLAPIINRVFGIMFRRNKFKEAPELLNGVNLDIKFVSQIAKAQRATEAENFSRALSVVAPIIEIQPEITDLINGDEVVKFASSIFSLPAKLLRGNEEVQAIREGRAQANAQAEQERQTQQQTDNLSKLAPNAIEAAREGLI